MSVTPDFVGQRYKDTSTGNIWIANSTTPGDWTLEVQNSKLTWEPKSSSAGEELGFITLYGLPTVTVMRFLETTMTYGFDIEEADGLTEIDCPNLLTVDPTDSHDGYIWVISKSDITTFSAPQLVSVASDVWIGNNDVLSTVNLGSLATVGGDLKLSFNSEIVSLDLGDLVTVSGQVSFAGDSLLTTIDISSLDSIGSQISLVNCSVLSSLNISALTSLGGNFVASGCAFDAATVNAILAQLVSIAAYGAGQSVVLNGGTSAAPSGQGIIDKGVLQGRGATVTTN